MLVLPHPKNTNPNMLALRFVVKISKVVMMFFWMKDSLVKKAPGAIQQIR